MRMDGHKRICYSELMIIDGNASAENHQPGEESVQHVRGPLSNPQLLKNKLRCPLFEKSN